MFVYVYMFITAYMFTGLKHEKKIKYKCLNEMKC